MNIDPDKPADKPTEELTEKELDGVTGGAVGTGEGGDARRILGFPWP